MKKTFRTIIYIILISAILFSSVGCGDTDDARLYFELSKPPITLDAQVASSDSELIIVRNIFEGLLRKNADGEIVSGACESYNKTGLTYTFRIRDNAKWSDGTTITADDFAFGIERALSPETKAPFAERLFAIENAKEVYSGQADTSALGISASGNSLSIRLSYDDKDFSDTLTTSVAMPCNRAFFKKCKGKYGLGSEYILSNGSYSITKWNKEDFGIRIYKNDEYAGEFEAKNYGVLISCRDDKTKLELILDNSIDMTFMPNSYIKEAKENEVNIKSYQNICWVMTISSEYNQNIRRAFAKLVTGSVYENSLPQGFVPATSIYPEILDVDGALGVGVTLYDKQGAWELFTSEISKTEDKVFPEATILYLDNDEIKPAVTAQAGHWQQNLSAFINIKAEDSNSFTNAFGAENEFDFAVFPIVAKGTGASEYLKNFGIVDSDRSEVQIQTELLSDNTIIPFAFENTNIAYTKAIENIFTEPQNGYVDFSFITKHE